MRHTYNAGTLKEKWADLSDLHAQPSLYTEYQATQKFLVRIFLKIKKKIIEKKILVKIEKHMNIFIQCDQLGTQIKILGN